MRSPSLGTALSSRDNSLNALRLILASAVIASHVPLGGYDHAAWERIGPLAVNGFFALSGFLIAGSRLRHDFGRYFERRARRIFPGFWVCLLVVAFVFAPIGGLLSGHGWSPVDSLGYVFGNAALEVTQIGIGNTLDAAPSPHKWNGSLWSLVYEVLAYLVFGALLGIAWVRRNLVTFAVIATLALPALAWWAGDLTGLAHKIENVLRLFSFFAAGILAYTLKERLPASHLWGAVAAVALAIPLFAASEFVMHVTTSIPLTYLLLYIGSTWRTTIAASEDVSFGMYIYGWPVQQLLAMLGVGALVPWPVFALLSVALTAPLAMASWRLVEKPAMRVALPRVPRPVRARREKAPVAAFRATQAPAAGAGMPLRAPETAGPALHHAVR